MKKPSTSPKKIHLLFLIPMLPMLLSWGTFGHEHINKAAVFALPEAMLPFFYNHIDFVTAESTVPDLRKYTLKDKSENPRHFIDLENFVSLDSLPLTLEEAKKKYDEKFLQQNGILPWYILEMMDKLTAAFKEKRKTEILFLAADLGHYLGDAAMPLHTSANHDGQQTNQKGIHSFWESRLPEMFGNKYNFNVPDAKYINNLQQETWKIIRQSHALVDSLLLIERTVRASFQDDKVFERDASGNILKTKFNQPLFTAEYAKAFHNKLNGMIEKQMKLAISNTSNYWFTAWVNAGKPDLSSLDAPEVSERNLKAMYQEKELFKNGNLFGIQSEKEY